MKQISPTALVPEKASSQRGAENIVCNLIKLQGLLHIEFERLIDHLQIIKMDTVCFTSKRNHICFEYINFYIIFSASLLYRIYIGL
jgi:hypothetical protein